MITPTSNTTPTTMSCDDDPRPCWRSSHHSLLLAAQSFDPVQLATAIARVKDGNTDLSIGASSAVHTAFQRASFQTNKTDMVQKDGMDAAMLHHDRHGLTALHVAASAGFLDGCRQLVDAWGSVNVPARMGAAVHDQRIEHGGLYEEMYYEEDGFTFVDDHTRLLKFEDLLSPSLPDVRDDVEMDLCALGTDDGSEGYTLPSWLPGKQENSTLPASSLKMKELTPESRDSNMFGNDTLPITSCQYRLLLAGSDEEDFTENLARTVQVFGRATVSALHIAACLGDLELCKAIHAIKPDLMMTSDSDVGGCIPVQVAAACGHEDVLRWMVSLDERFLKVFSRGDSLLHFACGTLEVSEGCSEEDLEVVREKCTATVVYLLEKGLEPEVLNRRDESAFGLAAACGNLDVLKLLLMHSGGRQNGWSKALVGAARKGYLSTVKHLVETFAVDPIAGFLECPICPLEVAAGNGHVAVVKYLFERLPRTSAVDRFVSVLDVAAASGREAVVEYLCGLDWIDVKQISSQTQSPILLATRSLSHPSFKCLLSHGFAFETPSMLECTDFAIRYGLDDFLETFLLDLNLLDHIQLPTLSIPLDEQSTLSKIFRVALTKANMNILKFLTQDANLGSALATVEFGLGNPILDVVSSGNLNASKYVLTHYPLRSINQPRETITPPSESNDFLQTLTAITPLSLTCSLKPFLFPWSTSMSRLLISHTADPHDKTHKPIFHAVQSGNLETVMMLVEDCRVDLEQRDERGLTPLALAALGCEAPYLVCKYLVGRGANVDVRLGGRHLLDEVFVMGEGDAVLLDASPQLFEKFPERFLERYRDGEGISEENAKALVDGKGESILHKFVRAGKGGVVEWEDMEVARRIVVEANMGMVDRKGKSALVMGVEGGALGRASCLAFVEQEIWNKREKELWQPLRPSPTDSATHLPTVPSLSSLPDTILFNISLHLDHPSAFLNSCNRLKTISASLSFKIHYLTHRPHDLLRNILLLLTVPCASVPSPLSIVKTVKEVEVLERRLGEFGTVVEVGMEVLRKRLDYDWNGTVDGAVGCDVWNHLAWHAVTALSVPLAKRLSAVADATTASPVGSRLIRLDRMASMAKLFGLDVHAHEAKAVLEALGWTTGNVAGV
ncbi:hypothetical protein HDU97_005814 [Phlyctochytrium planicorne]|nr:hypothetical protein HDU97_005814 [Phlyctochytrium planicorne]